MTYHRPVMLKECIAGLAVRHDGVYVDVTFGGGGHAKAILEKLEGGGHLYAFDQDEDSKANAEKIDNKHFTFINVNFKHIKHYLRFHGVHKVDGIMADLGVSSHQFDQAERGFSTRFNAVLDMRMDQTQGLTARRILNEYEEADLHRIFGMYGEVKNAKTLARVIVTGRARKKINTVDDFKQLISGLSRKEKINKYLAQVFQALRIVVNDELRALEEMLLQAAELIKKEGRLVVISYHSLEDRLVKNYINKGKFHGEVEKDIYGNLLRPFRPVNHKPIMSSSEELLENNRSRSAKLRIAEKI